MTENIMNEKKSAQKTTKDEIKNRYGAIARSPGPCCGPARSCGCTPAHPSGILKKLGYSDNDISTVPEGANLGLGCGNPVAIATLKKDEVVLDLGSGAGFDAFLAAKKVGVSGRVIGIDMTPEMIERARTNAQHGGYSNVEFRLGEIEHLPVDDNSVDVIISNCVINLATDKSQVFREAFRVLKHGGRFIVSDAIVNNPVPDHVRDSVSAYIGCASKALMKDEYLSLLRNAGFTMIEVIKETPIESGCECTDPESPKLGDDSERTIRKIISSFTVSAIKTPTPCSKKTL